MATPVNLDDFLAEVKGVGFHLDSNVKSPLLYLGYSRNAIDDQIYKNFAKTGAVTEPEKEVRAKSGEHLKQLLTEDHRYVFTLIQKFRTKKGERYSKLSDRDDVIVIADEAHRSQYDSFAGNMRTALPKAGFIGFTGTPLLVGEQATRREFGDYISTYNFRQSIKDGATVPLFYENRIPQLELTNTELNQEIVDAIESADLYEVAFVHSTFSPLSPLSSLSSLSSLSTTFDRNLVLDEAQENQLEREFSREYHLITRDERLDEIAQDIVTHFLGRGYQGKAMVVSIDRFSAVTMYNKVQHYWQQQLTELQNQLTTASDSEREQLTARIQYLEETDMAVVISSSQNEEEAFNKKGLTINIG
jgi:type I restriction enzyme R subunit